jgi:hypothetical protein
MTREQATWAMRHDWGLSVVVLQDDHHPKGIGDWYSVTVANHTTDPNEPTIFTFTDYQALREWAGY